MQGIVPVKIKRVVDIFDNQKSEFSKRISDIIYRLKKMKIEPEKKRKRVSPVSISDLME